MTLRFLTAGESHGPALTVIIEGLPSGVPLTAELVAPYLQARQAGHGRGARMRMESDAVEIMGGVRHGLTIGAPVAMLIRNRDFANWAEVMAVGSPPMLGGADGAAASAERVADSSATAPTARAITCPRPGHADLAGGLKHGWHDMRNVLERASARETAARVAAGTCARLMLEQCHIQLRGHVVQIGSVRVPATCTSVCHLDEWWATADASPVRCGDPATAEAMMAAIDQARQAKDSIGGIFEIVALNLPPGLGSYAQWDRRLDGRIAQAIMSIPGIKGVEIGLGFATAERLGSQTHDAIRLRTASASAAPSVDTAMTAFTRGTNHAGGLEGGMTNGEPLVVRAVMKPLATLMQPLPSVDVRTKQPSVAHLERADVCVVPAASVIAEAMLAWVLADALLEKCGGDSLAELQRNYATYRQQLQAY